MNTYYITTYHVQTIVILCIGVDWCIVDMLFAENVYIYWCQTIPI